MISATDLAAGSPASAACTSDTSSARDAQRIDNGTQIPGWAHGAGLLLRVANTDVSVYCAGMGTNQFKDRHAARPLRSIKIRNAALFRSSNAPIGTNRIPTEAPCRDTITSVTDAREFQMRRFGPTDRRFQ